MDLPLDSPVLLNTFHDFSSFNCGVETLNRYLKKNAIQNNQNRSTRTYVATRGSRVVGYYSLAAGSVDKSDTPLRVNKGLGNYPVPVILLARLAVDVSEQGKRLGEGLLKDAMIRIIQAAEIVGCRAVLVHAKDATAKAFYTKYGFESSPIDELHLYMLMKDVIATIGG